MSDRKDPPRLPRCDPSIEIKAKTKTLHLKTLHRPYRPILEQLLRGRTRHESEYAGQAKRRGDVEPKGSRTTGEKGLKSIAGI